MIEGIIAFMLTIGVSIFVFFTFAYLYDYQSYIFNLRRKSRGIKERYEYILKFINWDDKK